MRTNRVKTPQKARANRCQKGAWSFARRHSEGESGAPPSARRCWGRSLFDEPLELAELRAEVAHGFADLAKAALVAPQGSVCGAQLGLERFHLNREPVELARLERDDHHGDDQDHRE